MVIMSTRMSPEFYTGLLPSRALHAPMCGYAVVPATPCSRTAGILSLLVILGIAGHVLAIASAHCLYIDEALAILRVLPAFEQPDALHVVLSLGSHELAPSRAMHLAIQYGHNELVARFLKPVVATESWPLLQTAAERGNVQFLNKYLDPWVGKERRDEKDK
ncbi:hypothetical protein BC828DRAFT_385128 [Blastocladiella britannica]|nr:hypothetical protein BC828DRAFT_385128 [Blastocladiella britannica]